jgi:hypothetical protein
MDGDLTWTSPVTVAVPIDLLNMIGYDDGGG